MASSRKITLRSSDGVSFEVEQSVAALSQTINHMIEDNCADDAIPLQVHSDTLVNVIDYCETYLESARAEDYINDEDLQAWVEAFDDTLLFDLILAADYLDIKSLLDLTCQREAEMFKFKTPEEIRKTFTIKDGSTPEEAEEEGWENLWRENQFAFLMPEHPM